MELLVPIVDLSIVVGNAPEERIAGD